MYVSEITLGFACFWICGTDGERKHVEEFMQEQIIGICLGKYHCSHQIPSWLKQAVFLEVIKTWQYCFFVFFLSFILFVCFSTELFCVFVFCFCFYQCIASVHAFFLTTLFISGIGFVFLFEKCLSAFPVSHDTLQPSVQSVALISTQTDLCSQHTCITDSHNSELVEKGTCKISSYKFKPIQGKRYLQNLKHLPSFISNSGVAVVEQINSFVSFLPLISMK